MVDFGLLNSFKETADLLGEVYGKEFDVDFVKWMDECPRGPNRWYTAFDGGAPVGIYGMLPLTARIGSCVVRGALCSNVGVIPSHRRRGIFVELGRRALQDMKAEVVFGVPNDAAAPGHMIVGWRKIGRLELLRGRANKENLRKIYGDIAHRRVSELQSSRGVSEKTLKVYRAGAWRKWRYSKPGEDYWQSIVGDEMVVWKERLSVGKGLFKIMKCRSRQVMESSSDTAVFVMFDSDTDVDVMALKGSRRYAMFRSLGFKPVFGRDLILYPGKLNFKPDDVRFDPCDFDVF